MKFATCIRVLFASAAFFCCCGVRAQETWDKQSYWYGFYAGSTISVCQLLESGLLSKTDAKDYLIGLYQIDEEIPRVAPVSALNYIKSQKSFQGCPLP